MNRSNDQYIYSTNHNSNHDYLQACFAMNYPHLHKLKLHKVHTYMHTYILIKKYWDCCYGKGAKVCIAKPLGTD